MNKLYLNGVLLMLLTLFVGVNVFLLNVIIHEAGHYVAADYYSLDPEIEFDLESVRDSFNFSLESKSVASTRFLKTEDSSSLFVITLMGPFMNLLLGILFLISLLFSEKFLIRQFNILGVIISFMSFIMNIIPIVGSDGYYLFGI